MELSMELGIEETLKRLEAPKGVERPLVSTTRSEEEHGAAEQRSVESRAISPGEAEAALAGYVGQLRHEAACALSLGDKFIREGLPSAATDHYEAAKRVSKRADLLATLLPKPDSDAETPLEQ